MKRRMRMWMRMSERLSERLKPSRTGGSALASRSGSAFPNHAAGARRAHPRLPTASTSGAPSSRHARGAWRYGRRTCPARSSATTTATRRTCPSTSAPGGSRTDGRHPRTARTAPARARARAGRASTVPRSGAFQAQGSRRRHQRVHAQIGQVGVERQEGSGRLRIHRRVFWKVFQVDARVQRKEAGPPGASVRRRRRRRARRRARVLQVQVRPVRMRDVQGTRRRL